jgi:hypothetical protein
LGFEKYENGKDVIKSEYLSLKKFKIKCKESKWLDVDRSLEW